MQAFNGAGDTRTPTLISLIGFWIIQVPAAYLMAVIMGMGPKGVFIAIPGAEGIIALIYWLYFKRGKWKSVKV
jgi:Na+-driven multidrug efflux pump